MKNKEFIEELYNKTLPTFLEKITEEKEILAQSYKSYLERVYANMDIPPEKYSKALETFTESQNSRWQKLSQTAILQEFYPDDALIKLGSISKLGFTLAEKKISSGEQIEESVANQNIALLKEWVEKVKKFNTYRAQELLSEGTLDFLFAAGLTDKMSLRLGRIR